MDTCCLKMNKNEQMTADEKEVSDLLSSVITNKYAGIISSEFQAKLLELSGKLGKTLERVTFYDYLGRHGATKAFIELYKILEDRTKELGGTDIDFTSLFESPEWKELFAVYTRFLSWFFNGSNVSEDLCKDILNNGGLEMGCNVLKKKYVFEYTVDDKRGLFKVPLSTTGMLINTLQKEKLESLAVEKLRNIGIIKILQPYLNSSYVIFSIFPSKNSNYVPLVEYIEDKLLPRGMGVARIFVRGGEHFSKNIQIIFK